MKKKKTIIGLKLMAVTGLQS